MEKKNRKIKMSNILMDQRMVKKMRWSKILICGKGGSGKSTVAALLSKSIARRGYKVLVIDSDESNFGLHSQLGLKLPKDFMEYFGGKKGLKRFLGSRTESKPEMLRGKWKSSDIPGEYLQSDGKGINLLAIGKIKEFGEGCACPMNALSRVFIGDIELNDDEIMIIDTDAGIEHFGRGVEENCDIILVIVDPSYESIMLARKIEKIAEKAGKSMYFVINKVNDEIKDVLLSSLEGNRVVAVIPENKEIFKACLAGKKLDIQLVEIEKLANFLLQPEGKISA